MARLTSDLILSLIDRVSGPARGVGRSLDTLDRKQRLTAASAGGMGRAQSMVLGGAARLIAPLAAAEGIRQTVVAAAEFESALTGIQKKAGTTAAQTAAIGEEIKDLAKSGDLAVSIDEIAAGYERGAAAGIPLNELKEFATLSAKASDAFEMSASDVGNAAAGFKTVLKIPMNEMERYFDLINGLADSGIADESGIVNFIDRAGSMGKTFGLTAEQTAALGASLANMKVPAEQASTAVNSIFANLLAPQSMSKAGQAAFKQLVGSNKKFAAAVKKDANGAFIGLLDTLKELDESTRTGLIVDIFGKENMKTMLAMVEGSDEIKRNAAYAASTQWFGSLDKSYALKLDDMKSQWQLLKNDMSVLMIDIGTAGMPALKEGLEGAKYLIGEIGQGFEAFKAKIDTTEVGVAADAIANLGAAITKLLGLDTSQSAIPKFFEDIADAANDVAAAVNKVDQFFRKPFENWGNETVTPEKQAAIKSMQPEEQYDPGGTQSYREWLQAKRARDLAGGTEPVPGTMSPDPANIPAVNAASTPSRIASEKSLAERAAKRGIQGPNLPRDLGFGGYGPEIPATPTFRPERAVPTPTPERVVPIPTPRPQPQPPALSMADIQPRPQPIKPVDYQPLRPAANPYADMPIISSTPFAAPTVDTTGFDAAKLKALEAGTEMQASLGITAKPIVDISSASSALGVVRQLAAELRNIPGLAAAASSAVAGAASAGAARVDYDGLHADLNQ